MGISQVVFGRAHKGNEEVIRVDIQNLGVPEPGIHVLSVFSFLFYLFFLFFELTDPSVIPVVS